eukprot:snap_masked-scaffold_14-processed-gene-8.5-mRNA-1 protein AED:1.00 eAED:1.00 QI:0/0/0/0/1/1/2/0/348
MCFESSMINNCGPFGTCLDGQHFCVCEEGWTTSLEMVFFPFIRDDDRNQTELLSTLPCSFSESLLFGMIVVALILNTAEALRLISQFNTRGRVTRLTPLLMTFICYIIAFTSRLADMNKGFLDNSIFTVFLIIGVICQNFSTTVFVFKFISYHAKKMKTAMSTELIFCGINFSRVLQKTFNILLVYDCFSIFLLLAPLAIEDKRIGGTRVLTVMFLVTVSLSGLIKDMEYLLNSRCGASVKNSKFGRYIREAVPNLRSTIYIVDGYCLLIGPGLLSFVFVRDFQFVQVYFYVFNAILYSGMSLAIGKVILKNLNKAKQKRSKTTFIKQSSYHKTSDDQYEVRPRVESM